MFCCEPSLKYATAVNCCACPFGTEATSGLTAIDIMTGVETVRESLPLAEPSHAVMVPVPSACAVSIPEVLTDAMPDGAIDQAAEFVTFC